MRLWLYGEDDLGFRQHGLRKQIDKAVGGASLTQKFADSIGSDFFDSDAGEAVTKANDI